MISLPTEASRYIQTLRSAASQPLGQALSHSVQTSAGLIIAFYFAWQLTLISLVTFPLIISGMWWISRGLPSAIDVHNFQLTEATGIVSTAIRAIDTVKCCNGQHFEVLRYKEVLQKAAIAYKTVARLSARNPSLMRFSTFSIFALVFRIGNVFVHSEQLSSGDVVTAFWAFLLATEALQALPLQLTALQKGITAARLLQDILKDDAIHPENMTDMIEPFNCEGDIEFSSVSFPSTLINIY